MITFSIISCLINGLTSLFLSALIYYRSPYRNINKQYVAFGLSVAFWSFAYFFWHFAKNESQGLFFVKLLLIGAMCIPATFMHFVIEFLGLSKNRKYSAYLYLVYFIALFFIFIIFSNYRSDVIKDVGQKLAFKYWPTAGFLFNPFFAYFAITLLYSDILLYLHMRRSGKGSIRRNQIKYMLLGTSIGSIGGLTNYFLYYNIMIPPLGNILVSTYVIGIAYAILRYHLMDIRIAISRVFIFGIVYVLILGIPFWLGYITKSWFLSTALAVFLATIGPPIYNYLRRQAENRILQEDKKAQQMLAKVSEGMTQIRDLKELLEKIVRLVSFEMKIKNVSVCLLDKSTNQYMMKVTRYLRRLTEPISLEKEEPLIKYLNKIKSPFVYEKLKMENQHLQEVTQEDFSGIETAIGKLSASIIIPAFIGDFLIGFLVLDQRRDGRIYTQENLNVLQILANQAALAIENAIFYEETGKSLAETFHESRLRSIGTLGAGIGHQINNRFNAIAIPSQVVSMKIEEKNLIKLSSDELKQLVIESKKALDSITVDAIRGGKIATSLTSFSRKTESYQAISFAKVMDEALNLLSCKFKLEDLNLKQDISSDGSRLWGNLSQLDDVFFNLLDNAHDATQKKPIEAKEGAITIEHNYQPNVQLKAIATDKKRLKITLEDNGIGMTEEQFSKLFISFFTTKATSGKGTGLGLWIIKQIVEAHNGTITVESAYGKGTKFTINLPLATKEQIESSANSNSIGGPKI